MLRHAARLSRFAVRPRARPLSTIDMGDTSVSARFREPDPSKPRIVLAYSGGLDTSVILKNLTGIVEKPRPRLNINVSLSCAALASGSA